MIYNIKLFIIVYIVSHLPIYCHSFHASISSFDCKKNTSTIEITIKLFTDDIEYALRSLGNSELVLDSKTSLYNIDSLIFSYIKMNLFLSLNNNNAEFLWIGKEIDNDITWCYLEVLNIDELFELKIKNSLLFSFFDDQLNICHFYCSDKPETLMFHNGQDSGELKF